jgi:DNA polymerase alpha-associated DNA helicase A
MSPPSRPVPVRELAFFDNTLNESQRAAVKFALEAQEVACIHGPPGMWIRCCKVQKVVVILNTAGTGKTHTLIEIIRQLTTASHSNARPQRLLVCGASNLSVDNILERLLALPSSPPGVSGTLVATRVGHPARVMANEDVLGATLEVRAGKSDQVGTPPG